MLRSSYEFVFVFSYKVALNKPFSFFCVIYFNEGIINDIFGGDSRCQGCEYDSGKANYCCKYNLERRCCSYIAIGGSGVNPGKPNYNNPDYGYNNNYNSGSGSCKFHHHIK